MSLIDICWSLPSDWPHARLSGCGAGGAMGRFGPLASGILFKSAAILSELKLRFLFFFAKDFFRGFFGGFLALAVFLGFGRAFFFLAIFGLGLGLAFFFGLGSGLSAFFFGDGGRTAFTIRFFLFGFAFFTGAGGTFVFADAAFLLFAVLVPALIFVNSLGVRISTGIDFTGFTL